MRRPSGAALAEVMETTGWQQRAVRGLVSILGGKGGLKIESAKNAAGEGTYRRQVAQAGSPPHTASGSRRGRRFCLLAASQYRLRHRAPNHSRA